MCVYIYVGIGIYVYVCAHIYTRYVHVCVYIYIQNNNETTSPIRNFDSKVPEYSYFPGESISQTYHLRYIILLLFEFLFEKKLLSFFSSFFCLRSGTEIQKSYWV